MLHIDLATIRARLESALRTAPLKPGATVTSADVDTFADSYLPRVVDAITALTTPPFLMTEVTGLLELVSEGMNTAFGEKVDGVARGKIACDLIGWLLDTYAVPRVPALRLLLAPGKLGDMLHFVYEFVIRPRLKPGTAAKL